MFFFFWCATQLPSVITYVHIHLLIMMWSLYVSAHKEKDKCACAYNDMEMCSWQYDFWMGKNY